MINDEGRRRKGANMDGGKEWREGREGMKSNECRRDETRERDEG